MIRVILPFHLQTLASVGFEVELKVEEPVTQSSILDELERQYPKLVGTIRDSVTKERRPLLRFFACEQAGIWPDMMCLSKGISGGYLPLSLVLSTDAIYDCFYDDDVHRGFLHSHSYTGNPLACRAALATLDIFKTDDVINANKTRAKLLGDATREAFGALPAVRHLRQRGMIIAFDVDTAERDFSQRFFAAGLDQGVLLRPIGNTVYFMPPYIVEADDIAHLVGGAAAALKHCIGG